MAVSRAGPFYLAHLGGALLLFAVIALIIERFGIDRRITIFFYDKVTRSFPLRDDWFLEKVAHVGLKYVVVGLALAVLAAWVASFRVRRLASFRSLLLFIFLGMLLSSSVVSVLKGISGKHCPYDLEEYGGTVPYVGPLERILPIGMKPGKCWPGGHASAGFCLFAFYFAALKLGRRRLATAMLAGSLLLGFALGMGRVVQGAHFVSHNLWSALVCWLVTLALYEVLLRRRLPAKGD